ncbi:MAG: magnesium transporter [Chloroflexi bacterium]|nr:magnesium transporter [Chloroflexota bacterium]
MSEQSKLDKELVLTLVNEKRLKELRALLEEYHPADIAELLDEVPSKAAVVIFSRLPIEMAGEVLDETGSLVRQELVEEVDDEILANILDELPMDDAAEFLEDLPDEVSDRLLDLMEPEWAEDVREILSYDENSAGRLMTTDVAALRRQWTAAEAIEYMRSLQDIETFHYLYVVDRHHILIGVVPIRYLLLAQPDQLIEELMIDNVLSIKVTADQEELADFMSKYDYTAIPVVDDEGHLLGVVTVDDALDVLEEEATEDIQRLGGSQPLDQPYFNASVYTVAGKRVGWLLLLFATGSLTAGVSLVFSDVLVRLPFLTLFVALLIGTGGNAGTQTVATIIRAITLGEVRIGNLGRAWRREVAVGLMLGLAMGVVGFAFAALSTPGDWPNALRMGLVIALSLPAIVVWSTTIATLVPILADHWGIDATMVSGPMISTVVDATGLGIYYLLAGLIFGIF